MRKYTFLIAAGLSVLAAGSCRKNTSVPGGSSGQLVGNYTFLYLTTNINVTESASISGLPATGVLTGGYITQQNTGTVVFTADSAIGNGIGYSYDSTATITLTVPGIGTQTRSQALTGTVPPTSSASAYSIIGTDSVYFPGGVLGTGAGLSGAPAAVAPPTGGHFSFVGDTLIITTKVNSSYPDTSLGVAATAVANINATIKLLKK